MFYCLCFSPSTFLSNNNKNIFLKTRLTLFVSNIISTCLQKIIPYIKIAASLIHQIKMPDIKDCTEAGTHVDNKHVKDGLSHDSDNTQLFRDEYSLIVSIHQPTFLPIRAWVGK